MSKCTEITWNLEFAYRTLVPLPTWRFHCKRSSTNICCHTKSKLESKLNRYYVQPVKTCIRTIPAFILPGKTVWKLYDLFWNIIISLKIRPVTPPLKTWGKGAWAPGGKIVGVINYQKSYRYFWNCLKLVVVFSQYVSNTCNLLIEYIQLYLSLGRIDSAIYCVLFKTKLFRCLGT